MTPKQFAELCEYVQQNNGWADKTYEKVITSNRKAIKHISCNFDTRDGSIYQVTFSCITDWLNVRTFSTMTQSEVEAIYRWLDEPPVTEESMRENAFPTANFSNRRASS